MALDWHHRNYEMVVNEHGGKQSKLHRDWTLVPWSGMAQVVPVLEQGAENYGVDNWRNIGWKDHYKHLLEHSIAAGRFSDWNEREMIREHITHVVCRALFLLETLDEA